MSSVKVRRDYFACYKCPNFRSPVHWFERETNMEKYGDKNLQGYCEKKKIAFNNAFYIRHEGYYCDFQFEEEYLKYQISREFRVNMDKK